MPYEAVNAQIQEVLRSIRIGNAKVDNGRVHSALISDRRFGSDSSRAVIGIPTRGCGYARSRYGGCSVCGHNASMLWRKSMDLQEILQDFEESLESLVDSRPTTICAYTSGSFLDQNELSLEGQEEIMRRIGALPYVDTVAIESLPYFVNRKKLELLRSHLGSRKIVIGMGLDSSSDLVRRLCFQRHIGIKDYMEAVRVCNEFEVESVSYLVYGNPLLSKSICVMDTAQSLHDVFDLGFSIASIEPVAIQPKTIQYAFAKAGLFKIPSIWDLYSLLRSYRNLFVKYSSKIFLGGQVFTPIPLLSLRTCRECLERVKKLTPYVNPGFWSGIPIENRCSCGQESTNNPTERYDDRSIVAVIQENLDKLNNKIRVLEDAGSKSREVCFPELMSGTV